MKTLTFIAFSILLSCVKPVMAREHSDLIVMKNGDRLTGEIKGSNAGVLYVDLDYVDGTVSVEWSKVALLSSKQPFIVKTENGAVYSGTIQSVESSFGIPMKLQVRESSEKKVALNGPSVVELDQTSEKFWRRLNGAIDFGTTYSKGNQASQYNLGSQTEYLRERWKTEANFNSVLSSSAGTNASTRNQLGLRASRYLPWKNYFYAGLGSFLQSSEQGITDQTNVGGGVGRYFKNTNQLSFSILAGMAWQSTKYKPVILPINRQNIAATVIAADLKAYAFKKTSLTLSANLFPAVSEPGRVFFNTNTTYYIKVFGNLSWNMSFYGNWDNHPPGRFSGSDYGSSSGLSWTFGNHQ